MAIHKEHFFAPKIIKKSGYLNRRKNGFVLFATKFLAYANIKIFGVACVIAEIFSIIARAINLIEDVMKIEGGGRQSDIELIYDSVTDSNLKDKDLQQAYGCAVPSDIVPLLFKTGKIGIGNNALCGVWKIHSIKSS